MENLFSLADHKDFFSRRSIWVNGPVIVGAGPSGLATAACLREQGVPFAVLERSECIASLWQKRTYDKLKLHIPKQFCQLPKLPFLEDFPEYPSKKQFKEYLESYSKKFEINPRFNECVQSARYDETSGLWRVKTVSNIASTRTEVEYICRSLVVATGENAESVTPDIEGLAKFGVDVMHVCDYKSGEKFKGKKVLVVGCGNSGMEVTLELSNHNASLPWPSSSADAIDTEAQAVGEDAVDPAEAPAEAARNGGVNQMEWAQIVIPACLASVINIALKYDQVKSQHPAAFHLLCLAILLAFASFFISKLIESKFLEKAPKLEKFGVFFIATAFFITITIQFPFYLKFASWAVYTISVLAILIWMNKKK